MEQDVRVWPGCLRLMEQLHPGFQRRVTRFPMVARDARAGNVLPDMGAASVSGHHMVNSEVLGLLATVLANVAISDEHFLS